MLTFMTRCEFHRLAFRNAELKQTYRVMKNVQSSRTAPKVNLSVNFTFKLITLKKGFMYITHDKRKEGGRGVQIFFHLTTTNFNFSLKG